MQISRRLLLPVLLQTALFNSKAESARSPVVQEVDGLIPNSYIVRLKTSEGEVSSGAIISDHYAWLDSVLAEDQRASGYSLRLGGRKPGVVRKYSATDFKGYVGTFSKTVVDQIQNRSDVTTLPP